MEGIRQRTVVESIADAHRLVDRLEAAISSAESVIGMGIFGAKDAATGSAPSRGLRGDADELCGRLENALNAMSAVNNALSAPPSISEVASQGTTGMLRNSARLA